MNEIISLLKSYLKLKDDYKEFNKENLYDVFTIFANEVFELDYIVSKMDYKINMSIEGFTPPVNITVNEMNFEEEELLNEIADVLLTTARLIKEFKLEEPLTEMLQYKYYRQAIREEKIKNHQKITG